ncbi:MAG: site-specific integrase [Christensenellales bacterium]
MKKKTMHIRRTRYYIEKQLIVKEPKTSTSKRILSIPDLLIEELKEYKKWYDEMKNAVGDLWKDADALLLSDEGKIIYPSCYRMWLKKALKKAGLKEVSLHSLRHTNITLMLTSGIDLKTVSARAGHARTSTTTDIYSHFLESRDVFASNVIDNIFGKKI